MLSARAAISAALFLFTCNKSEAADIRYIKRKKAVEPQLIRWLCAVAAERKTMFIYSVRASTLKFFAVIILTVALLVAIIALGTNTGSAFSASSESIDFSGIKTNDDRLEFITQFVSEVSGEPKETVTFSIPENFDRILLSYNEIQKAQGLDITKYKNKKVTRYTYELPSYEEYEKPVFINLIVYRGTVVACDISSADPEGFVKPLVKLD